MNKQELRIFAKEKRSTLDIDLISNAIADNIRNFPKFQMAKNVLLFYPIKHEINLLTLSNTNGKSFFLPKVKGEELLVCPYDCNVKLEKSNNFNILEPCSNPISPQIIDFAIIPCLMADKIKNRLGYGKGFYDRFIPRLNSKCVKISPVASPLLIDRLPTDIFDCKPDFICTENLLF